MNKFRLAVTVAVGAGVCLAAAPRSYAQGPGGGMNLPPQIQAKIKLWQKWQLSHKNLSNLQRMLMQVQQVDRDPATKLTKPQAAKVLAVYKAWQSKPTMTEDQAKSVSKQIGAVLTEKQLKKMATMRAPWERGGGRPGGGMGGPGGGGPGGPGGMRPGGSGGPGGARPGGMRPGGAGGPGSFPDPPAKGFNPMNPDTLPFTGMRPMAKKGQQDFLKSLQSR
ncbi:MAG TPA: hypothetical protein VGN26_06495 [Armatimonadota bacterium]|jgi:hypothetical protein